MKKEAKKVNQKVISSQLDDQSFKVGDKVIDIISREIGLVKGINLKESTLNKLKVEFHDEIPNNYQKLDYSLDGRYANIDKYPRLLHYRDNYDYTKIDFNNLPQRQEPKRRRAEKGKRYFYVNEHFEAKWFRDQRDCFDNSFYNIGNYFQTEAQAQEMADKLKELFLKL